MGTDLYAITATKTKGMLATLDVREVYADAGLSADKSFALMILHEATKPGDPLAEEVGFDEVLDRKWMSKYAGGFIAKVQLKDKRKGRATLEVTVTDPAWIAHVKPKLAWDSRAFAIASTYEPCKPITPTSSGADTDAAAGFMVAPMSIWNLDASVKNVPATALVPAYGAGGYRVACELKGPFDMKRLASLNFRAVRLVSDGSSRDGILALHADGFYLCHIGTGSRGHMGNGYAALERIGLLELKPKARLGEKLSYAKVVEAAGSRIVAMRAKGAVASIDIGAMPDGRMPEIKSASDVLRIVAAPLVDYTSGVGNGRTPLGKALLADCKPDEIGGDDMFVEFANSYVKSYELAKPKKVKVPALDTMDLAAVRAWFEAPPPVATLTVTMTDARWLEHLAKAKPPYPVEEYALARAKRR